jgi:hypothetical protein
MAAKSDHSRTNQNTSTTNNTHETTETYADSFNRTLNFVTNTSNTTAPALPTWLLPVILGGGAIATLFLVALARR